MKSAGLQWLSIAVTAMLAGGGPAYAAVWTRLSAGAAFGTVAIDYRLSADGRWAVFEDDSEVDGTEELWSVPGLRRRRDGSARRSRPGAEPSTFAISPDSRTVVYLADQDTDGVFELLTCIEGGVSTKLNGALVSGGDVVGFKIAATSQRVVYWADQQVDERRELWSVPIGGGASTKLNGALAAGGFVFGFALDPNGQRVVYLANQQAYLKYELYTLPSRAGAGRS